MGDIITHKVIPLDVLITSLHKIHLKQTFEMVDTRSNMQFYDLNSKPHGGKILQNVVGRAMSARLYPTPVSLHYQQLLLGQFREPTHINFEQKKKSDIKKTRISSACNCTTKARAD